MDRVVFHWHVARAKYRAIQRRNVLLLDADCFARRRRRAYDLPDCPYQRWHYDYPNRSECETARTGRRNFYTLYLDIYLNTWTSRSDFICLPDEYLHESRGRLHP